MPQLESLHQMIDHATEARRQVLERSLEGLASLGADKSWLRQAEQAYAGSVEVMDRAVQEGVRIQSDWLAGLRRVFAAGPSAQVGDQLVDLASQDLERRAQTWNQYVKTARGLRFDVLEQWAERLRPDSSALKGWRELTDSVMTRQAELAKQILSQTAQAAQAAQAQASQAVKVAQAVQEEAVAAPARARAVRPAVARTA